MKKIFIFLIFFNGSISSPLGIPSRSDTAVITLSSLFAGVAHICFENLEDHLMNVQSVDYQNSFLVVYHLNTLIKLCISSLCFLAVYHSASNDYALFSTLKGLEARYEAIIKNIKENREPNYEEIKYDLMLLKHEIESLIITASQDHNIYYRLYGKLLKKGIKKYSTFIDKKIQESATAH